MRINRVMQASCAGSTATWWAGRSYPSPCRASPYNHASPATGRKPLYSSHADWPPNSDAQFGHREFILAAGHLSWAIKNYFLDYHARLSDVTVRTAAPGAVTFHDEAPLDDWTVTVAETGAETMTAGRVRRIARYLGDDESFMLTYGDGVADIDLAELAAFHRSHGRMVTMTGVIPPGRFGELVHEGDRVIDWAEKPVTSDRYINGGFMVIRREFIDRFLGDKADDVMLEREPLAEATAAGELTLYRHHGFWQCMDTMRDWELLNDLWEQGDAPWATRELKR